MLCSLLHVFTAFCLRRDDNSHGTVATVAPKLHVMPLPHFLGYPVSALGICTENICSVPVVPYLSYDLPHKSSKPRPLNYWNSGESRYTPHPKSIFASQHKNSSNGLFSTVRQNSACSDFKQPSYTESALGKKKKRLVGPEWGRETSGLWKS